MTIPVFDPDTGLLPAGEHVATWVEVVERFGWNPWRRRLLEGLAEAIDALRDAGCHRIWINGSFVTAKDEPGDFDVTWDLYGVDLDRLDPVLLDLAPPRAAQKHRFGGDLLPNLAEGRSGARFSEFFQADRDGRPKGIVVMAIGATEEATE